MNVESYKLGQWKKALSYNASGRHCEILLQQKEPQHFQNNIHNDCLVTSIGQANGIAPFICRRISAFDFKKIKNDYKKIQRMT